MNWLRALLLAVLVIQVVGIFVPRQFSGFRFGGSLSGGGGRGYYRGGRRRSSTRRIGNRVIHDPYADPRRNIFPIFPNEPFIL